MHGQRVRAKLRLNPDDEGAQGGVWGLQNMRTVTPRLQFLEGEARAGYAASRGFASAPTATRPTSGRAPCPLPLPQASCRRSWMEFGTQS